MPRMSNSNTGTVVTVPDSLVERYTARGFTADGDSGATDDTPPMSATKGEWVDHAEALGLDVDGMTKDEVIDAVKGA